MSISVVVGRESLTILMIRLLVVYVSSELVVLISYPRLTVIML